MKKFVFLTFSLILLLVSAGCGSGTEESGDGSTAQTETESIQVESEVASEEAVSTDGGDDAYPYPNPGQETSSFDPSTVSRPELEAFPKFDGKLAFHSDRLGGLDIYVLDGASSELARIERGEQSSLTEPAWESACEAVYMTIGDANNHFFIGRAEAVDQAASESFINLGAEITWNPSPSPTGDAVAYQVNRDRRINICFVGPNGEDLGCMDRGAFSNSSPSWSADGQKIAFSTDRDNNAEIYVMDYPNGAITRLTESPYFSDRAPSISPDGTRIAFQSLRGAGQNIYVVNIDGTNEIEITSDGADNKNPVWIGNDMLAYQSAKTGNVEILMSSVDNPTPVQLTYNLAEDAWPAWCPSS